MAPIPGTRLGRYQITAEIGAGGMGEVYRAIDTDLKRVVAVKVLPATVASDPGRLARFQREAEILASLNHPNIAIIHGLEKADGVHAIVMELVEGRDLSERIAQGPIPIDQALPIARQIAEALEAAHQAGVIHRDLKPSNVKVRSDGTVKVLDFGLAKALDPGSTDNETSQFATQASPARTLAGVILGTAAYMSPEQARGQPVDKRTDVWAFGCVLYEMLTGRAPFARQTMTDSMAAILERDPDWTTLPRATPAALRRLVARCLAKDRQQRLRDIGDARLEIDEALALPKPAASVSIEHASRHTSRWVVAMLATAVATALVTWTFQGQRSVVQSAAPFPAHFAIAAPAGYQLDLNRSPVGVSPDGRSIAFAASRGSVQRIYVRDMDKLEATPIAGTEGGFAPFFSPDGQWVGFFANQKIRKVLRSGGASVSIADFSELAGNRSVSASWDAQDTIFFTPDVTKGIWRVASAGGTPTAVTTPIAGESFHIWPQLLPGSKAILFSAVGDGPDPHAYVQVLETGERKPLVSGLGTRYVPTGHLVFVQAGSLMAVPFDLSRLEVTGSPMAVVSGVTEPFRLRATASGFNPLFDISPTGTLAFLSADRPPQHALVWVDRSGREQPLGASGGTYAQPRVSPDGRRVAVVVRGDDHDDVWLYDLGRNTWDRFTAEGNSAFPTWTRDGTRLAYSSDRGGSVSVEWKRVDGTGVGETLLRTERATRAFPFSWSPDGVLAFVYLRPAQHIWLVRPGDDGPPAPFLATPFVEGAPMFAPDGRAIAYVSSETGRNEIYIRPFPGPGEKLTITNEGGIEPFWPPNGRELFYRNGDAMMAVDVSTSPTLRVGTPRRLFDKHYEPSLAMFANYSATADGQRFVMIKRIDEGESPTHINVAINWFDELRRATAAK